MNNIIKLPLFTTAVYQTKIDPKLYNKRKLLKLF